MIHISSNFDSGNMELIDASSPGNIRLSMNKDAGDEFMQWFHFRATGVEGQDCKFIIENAHEAAYMKGWEDYQAVASYDREYWFRVETDWNGKSLTISHTPDCNSVYYAYFAPYELERHRDLIASCQTAELCRAEVLGQSLDGEDMDLLIIGEPAEHKKNLWAIARQHPGESMAEWWMEGMLARLLDQDDPIAKAILDKACFYVVPNMNPDGSRRGHLRTNASGANLNREWLTPTMERSPEVFVVREKMAEIGLDFCLDVHGDEGLPYNFIAGADGIPGISEEEIQLRIDFETAYRAANPDFQSEFGYPKAAPGTTKLLMCTAYLAHTYKKLCMTLEMPFKDNANSPDPMTGWSPERSRKLGASSLDAIHAMLGRL